MGGEIYNIINDMAEVLNTSQMQKLQEVLVNRLSENNATDYLQTGNEEFLDMFLTAKRLEGRSDKTIRYYKCNIQKMLEAINVPVVKKSTEMLRKYLVEYQTINIEQLPFICYVAFDGKLVLNAWYIPIILFLKAIIFGGIEEVGWRYVFQPVMQERCNYITSTMITFVSWGIWHFSYFYIEGTLPQVQKFGFLLGLLTNRFILSALFIKTNNLWICVMTHSLINVFSQLVMGESICVICL